jgi:putative ABC transport system permease protein
MNILNELTIKNLKLNKKRTIVTIVGIVLSVALICAVAGMVTSFRATLVNIAITDGGNRHLTIENVSKKDLKYFTNNSHVKSMYLSESFGYAKVDNINKYKPYAYVVGYTKSAFDNTTLKLVSGRLPENNKEIIVSVPFKNSAKVKIGDTISLDIGKRVCTDGTILNQSNPYFVEEGETDLCREYITDTSKHEYKIVGITERLNYNIEGYSAPGYTLITKIDKVSDNINVSLLFKDAKYYKEYINNIANDNDLNKYNITLNDELLRWSGASLSDRTMNMLYAVAGVVIGIIILTSVFVIKNSFDIANQEKKKMYGMLSSIGATSKQIKKNVLHEGFILGLIGIPLGILSGIFADYILVIIINYIGNFNDVKFVFSISIWPVILSIILGVVTIYLSVVRAAKKSSKIAPIEAIRNNNEIKINSKKIKSSKIVDKLFGVGGDIAYKNLKRNKKRNRTTIISIVISVAVFISLSSFLSYGFKLTNQYYQDANYDIQLYLRDTNEEESKKIINDIIKMDNVSRYSIIRSMSMIFDYKKYYNEDVLEYFGGVKDLSLRIMSVGEEEFERILKENKISDTNFDYKGLLIDKNIFYQEGSKNYKEVNLLDLNKFKTVTGSINNKDLNIEILKRIDNSLMGFQKVYSETPTIIVSDEFYDYIVSNYNVNATDSRSLYIKSTDAEKLESLIKEYLLDENITNYSLFNIETEAKAQRSLITLVAIFLYGFIIVISLIGVTNIINTISTNMNLRRREFAMLKSIGMTKNEFNKMINLESIMYSTKALIIGIPLGLLGSFAIYKAFANGSDYGFIFPWQAILIAIFVVYILVSLIMYFALRKTKSENIIDTIKDENI